MSIVYVPQNMHHRDRLDGILKPKFDLSPAETWGTLVELVSPTAKPFNANVLIEEMREKLKDFSDADFILPIGNASILAMAVSVAQDMNQGRVRLLQWSGTNQSHVVIQCNF